MTTKQTIEGKYNKYAVCPDCEGKGGDCERCCASSDKRGKIFICEHDESCCLSPIDSQSGIDGKFYCTYHQTKKVGGFLDAYKSIGGAVL